jgi:hypothetical protein
MRRAGLRRSALYLVRPDGYVALADPRADTERLRDYLSSVHHTLPTDLAFNISEADAHA